MSGPLNLSAFDAIAHYHDLLANDAAMAQGANDQLRADSSARGLYFGERPICVVLRPHFYTRPAWDYLKDRMERLLRAFDRAHEVCFANDDARAQLYLDPYEEELFQLDAGAPVPWTSSRLDTFYVVETGTLKCVEYNAETPAGLGYNDRLIDIFDTLEPMRRFRERYHTQPMHGLPSLFDAVRTAYKQWGGPWPPHVAILDWREVPTLNEHEICRIFFEHADEGVRARLVDPRELSYVGGKLYAGDWRIDVVYKRVLYSELVGVLGSDNPLLNAYRDRAVFMTNAPSAKLMAKKASLAFLSDEQNAHLFDAAMLDAIHQHIPWTRVVRARRTTYAGRSTDLVEFILTHKDRLVLKPNDEYGGKGVVLGWECSSDAWEAALRVALEGCYVVQEKVEIVTRDFPMWLNGALDVSSRFVDADPYVFNGTSVDGCLTRLSPVALLNVTAGGGSVVPTFIIEER